MGYGSDGTVITKLKPKQAGVFDSFDAARRRRARFALALQAQSDVSWRQCAMFAGTADCSVDEMLSKLSVT